MKEEYLHFLYDCAMKLRMNEKERSSELLMELIELDPGNYESRLKLSWILIRSDHLSLAREVLLDVVNSEDATFNQRQRAYTNISCCWNFDVKQPKYAVKAEKAARNGINLNGTGTIKLWENLTVALKKQEKYEEALEAYERLIIMDIDGGYEDEVYKMKKLIKKNLKLKRKSTKKGLFAKSEGGTKKKSSKNTETSHKEKFSKSESKSTNKNLHKVDTKGSKEKRKSKSTSQTRTLSRSSDTAHPQIKKRKDPSESDNFFILESEDS